MAQSTSVVLHQLRGMIRYESRSQWRGGSWKVLTFGYLVLAAAATLFTLSLTDNAGQYFFSRNHLVDHYRYEAMYDETSKMFIQIPVGEIKVLDWLPGGAASITDAQIQQAQATALAVQSLRLSLMFMLVALPIMMSEVIPLDRKLNLRDLINSLPLPLWVYLGGKVLNVWVNAIKVGLAALMLICLITIGRIGWFDPVVVLIEWLVSTLAIMLFVAVLAVLLPSFAANRRAALLVGIIMIPFTLIAFVGALMVMYDLPGIVNPLYRFSSLMESPYLPTDVLITDVAKVYLNGSLIMLVVWIVMWAIQRWQHS